MRTFLKKSDLKISEFVNLGSGALVLATKKGLKIEKIDELKTLSKIAMPDAAKTVYGKRASEFMQKANLEGELKDKNFSSCRRAAGRYLYIKRRG